VVADGGFYLRRGGDFADLALLAQNYNHSAVGAPLGFESDWAAAQMGAAEVPEPSLAGLLLLLPLTMGRRRFH
jgi:hypothetical protein